MHSQKLIMNLNKSFCKDAKWIHISQSKGPVAGHYMITNSSFANYLHYGRFDIVTAMLLMVQFYWDLMQFCWQDVPSIIELLYAEDKVIMFLLNVWNYSPADSVSSHGTSIPH